MNNDNEKTNEATGATPSVFPPAYIYPQYNVAGTAGQQFMYAPQPVQFSPSPRNVEMESLVEKEGACQRRSWCSRRSGGCCIRDDGRPFGTYQNFVQGLFFGTVSPLFSVLMMFGMETSKLSRVGTLFGTANNFLMLSSAMLWWSHHHPEHFHFWGYVFLKIVGIIFLVIAVMSFRRFLYIYRIRQEKTPEEKVKVISQIGCRKEFLITFFVSLFFPVIGTFIGLIARRNYLYGRYGALSGFGCFLLVVGILCSFTAHIPVPLFIGLFIVEFALVHFRRAIICAEISQDAISA